MAAWRTCASKNGVTSQPHTDSTACSMTRASILTPAFPLARSERGSGGEAWSKSRRITSSIEHGNPRAPLEQVGVEHRQPFAEPEARNRWLGAVIDLMVLDRFDRQQVPGVKELVRCFGDYRAGVARQVCAARAECD